MRSPIAGKFLLSLSFVITAKPEPFVTVQSEQLLFFKHTRAHTHAHIYSFTHPLKCHTHFIVVFIVLICVSTGGGGGGGGERGLGGSYKDGTEKSQCLKAASELPETTLHGVFYSSFFCRCDG